MKEPARSGKGRRRGGCPTVALVSLGCPKNLVDSEAMALALEEGGFSAAGDVRGADVLIVNTCSFVNDATAESARKLEEALELKREGVVRRVVAAGCLVQRLGEDVLREFPGLDGAVGTASWHKIAEVCRAAIGGGRAVIAVEAPGAGTPHATRRSSSFGHFAYLKVTEGCHRRCSYCVIPQLRGPLRSVPPDVVLREARVLAEAGSSELILVGEDTGAYGTDLGGEWTLARLIRELDALDGVRWIRMLYVHPASVCRELVAAAEECEKVCAYIDLPVQHASDPVLSRMNRPTTRADIERALGLIRSSPKEFAIRTTVMVGFPGEKPEDFEELKLFLKEWEFDHLGAFCYSAEFGTAAAAFPDQLPEEVKEDRREEIMRLQSDISYNRNVAVLGQEAEVLVDGVVENGLLAARTERQAPEVDGVTLVRGGGSPGEYMRVRFTEASEYDLAAVALEGQAR